MTNRRTLTASNIRYLLTMKELDRDGCGVRCVDLASALNLSKPSVHNMMDTFSELGIISKPLTEWRILPIRATIPRTATVITMR